MADNPERRTVAQSAKRTVSVNVRLTILEAQRVRVAARQHDPPTVAAWLRDLIAGQVRRGPRPPAPQ